jgi:serine/threonine protein kinase
MNRIDLPYPANIDFRKAVMNPKLCFQDEELRQATPVIGIRRQPIAYTGNFAIVFKLESERSSWAVRCFTSPVREDIIRRYQAIYNYQPLRDLSYFVEFEFLEQGIQINEEWYPILKMDWIDGKTLDDYIDEAINMRHLRQIKLEMLRIALEQMQQELKQAKIAHGDLQHGNILITPRQELKLVDYDEIYIPDLKDYPPDCEKGHPNYQHPQRSLNDWGEDIDEFSFNVIILSVNVLARDYNFWHNFHQDNALLFTKEDFCNYQESKIFQALDKNKQFNHDERLLKLTQDLGFLCEKYEKLPPSLVEEISLVEIEIHPTQTISKEPAPAPVSSPPPPRGLPTWVLPAVLGGLLSLGGLSWFFWQQFTPSKQKVTTPQLIELK